MNEFFNKYFWNITSGRLSRMEYWIMFGISVVYVMLILGIIVLATTINPSPTREFKSAMFGGLVVSYIPLMWTSIIVCVKRVRDCGLSGWWYTLQLIPYLGLVAALVYAFTPTDYFLRFKKTQEVVTAA